MSALFNLRITLRGGNTHNLHFPDGAWLWSSSLFYPWEGLGPECLGQNSGFNTHQPVWPWGDYPTSLFPGFHLTHHPCLALYIKDNKSSTSLGGENKIGTHVQYLHQSLTQSKCQLLLVHNVKMSFTYVHSPPPMWLIPITGEGIILGGGGGRGGGGGVCWEDKNEQTWPLFLKESQSKGTMRHKS